MTYPGRKNSKSNRGVICKVERMVKGHKLASAEYSGKTRNSRLNWRRVFVEQPSRCLPNSS